MRFFVKWDDFRTQVLAGIVLALCGVVPVYRIWSSLNSPAVANGTASSEKMGPKNKPIATQGATGDLGPGAPPLNYIRNPTLAPMQETINTGDGSLIGVHEIGLYGCVNNESVIDCYLTERNLSNRSRYYRINNLFGPETRLIDDLHQDHKKVQAAWIDGKGHERADLNQGPDDPAWFVLKFDSSDPEVMKVRIEFSAFTGGHIEGSIISP